MGKSGTGWETLEAVWDGLGTLGEVRDGSGDPQRSLGRVVEVRDRTGDPRGCLGRVRRPLVRSGMGQGTLVDVRNRSGDPWKGLGWVPTRPGPPEGCPDPSQTSRRVSRPVPDLPEGVPTRP